MEGLSEGHDGFPADALSIFTFSLVLPAPTDRRTKNKRLTMASAI